MVVFRSLARSSTLALALAGCAAVGTGARADSLWVSSGGTGKPLQYDNVQITRVEGGALFFRAPNGNETKRDFKQVVRMRVDDEPAFNVAEDAYQAQKYDVATDGYFKTLKSSAKEWLKQYVAPRLVDSAQKANRFDAAAFAYTSVLVHDPTTAKEIKLAIPQQNSTYLTTAIVDVKTAMADTKLTPEQKLAVGNFLLELEKAKRDPMAGTAQEQAAKTAGGESSAVAAASSAQAKQRLDAAALALQQKDYAKAVAEINAARVAYRTPADQAQALYTLAEAQAGIAATSGGGNDENGWKDAAIAYLRVVASDAKDSPLVAQSLLKAAAIEERLKDLDAARSLYQQVAQQFPNDAATAQANQAIARLSSAAPAAAPPPPTTPASPAPATR